MPNLSVALQGANVLGFSSSLSRALLLSILERYLAVLATLFFDAQRDPPSTHRSTTILVVALCLTFILSIYLPVCLLAVAAYVAEYAACTALSIATVSFASYTSLHRSFAQPLEVIDRIGMFKMPFLETEAVGKIDTDVYNACIRERQWCGF